MQNLMVMVGIHLYIYICFIYTMVCKWGMFDASCKSLSLRNYVYGRMPVLTINLIATHITLCMHQPQCFNCDQNSIILCWDEILPEKSTIFLSISPTLYTTLIYEYMHLSSARSPPYIR